MLDKDLDAEIRRKSRKDGTDRPVVARDYLIGVMASAANEVYGALETGDKGRPIIGGGIALRKGHFPDFPRNTDDIDFTARGEFFDRDGVPELVTYEKGIRDIAELARERINAVHGPQTLPDDIVVKGIRKTSSRNNNDGGTLRAGVIFSRFLSHPTLGIDIETNTSRNPDFFTSPVTRDVIHPFSDGDALRLGTIQVNRHEKIHGDKLYAFLERLTTPNDAGKFSRMKDIFDTWFMSQKSDNESYLEMFARRMKEEEGYGHDTEGVRAVMDAAIRDPVGFRIWLAGLVKHGMPRVQTLSDSEAIRKVVSGLITRYDFPESDDLVETFANKLKKAKDLIA